MTLLESVQCTELSMEMSSTNVGHNVDGHRDTLTSMFCSRVRMLPRDCVMMSKTTIGSNDRKYQEKCDNPLSC